MINGTYGTMYYVDNMDKAVKFYKEALGMSPEGEPSPQWTSFNLNGHRLCLHGGTPEQVKAYAGKGVLIMNAKGLKAFAEDLAKRGVEIEQPYHQVCEGGYAIDFRDGQGNLVSAFEYLGN